MVHVPSANNIHSKKSTEKENPRFRSIHCLIKRKLETLGNIAKVAGKDLNKKKRLVKTIFTKLLTKHCSLDQQDYYIGKFPTFECFLGNQRIAEAKKIAITVSMETIQHENACPKFAGNATVNFTRFFMITASTEFEQLML